MITSILKSIWRDLKVVEKKGLSEDISVAILIALASIYGIGKLKRRSAEQKAL